MSEPIDGDFDQSTVPLGSISSVGQQLRRYEDDAKQYRILEQRAKETAERDAGVQRMRAEARLLNAKAALLEGAFSSIKDLGDDERFTALLEQIEGLTALLEKIAARVEEDS